MRSYFALLCLAITLTAPGARGGTLAVFRSALGEMDVELFDVNKPQTVANFVRYVESGFYNNMFIHRWEPNFVIQGGGFYTANRHTTNAAAAPVATFPAVTNEYSVGRIFSNTYGTIAMARVGGQTNSATSQWFFNLTNNASLDRVDGGFTVFGRVLRGTNVLNRFLGGAASTGIFRTDAGGALGSLPVLAANPTYEDLFYTDVTLLRAKIERGADGARLISWQSVSNALNRVEFTNQTPPNWATLVSTNGTGQLMQITDASADLSRVYRIRVDF
jgi:cyclophilin family peptidyl-prolyl cis-trans isomerase